MKKLPLLIVVLLVCAFALAACGEEATTTTSSSVVSIETTTSVTDTGPKSGGTLVWIKSAGPKASIGYVSEITGSTDHAFPQLAEQRLFEEMRDGSLEPCLAESYEVDAEGTPPSVTVYLKEGITFSDGTDFDAEAVKWNIEDRLASPGYSGQLGAIDSVEVLDEYTVKINVKNWENSFLRAMGSAAFFMISPTAYQTNGIEWVRENIVGTGPFVQGEYQPDVSLSFVANPDYWEEDRPYLDEFEWLFVPDELTAVAMFKAGEADVMESSNPQVLDDLVAEGNVIATYLMGPVCLYPDSANADSPWSNLQVRQAAEYALDRETIAASFGYGCEAAYQFSSSNSKAYDPDIEGREYDVTKAMDLMEEAGYADGFKTTLISAPFGVNKDMATALQSYLAAIGIEAELQFPTSDAWPDIYQGEWQNAVLISGNPEFGNQNSTFNMVLNPGGFSYVSVTRPEGWAEALAASKTTSEADSEKLQVLENMIYDTSCLIPIYFTTQCVVTKPYVMDLGMGDFGANIFFDPASVWLDK